MDIEGTLFGCSYECPAQERIEDCPFNEFAHLPFKEKVIWIENISVEKKESIIRHHLYCSKNRKLK